MANPPFEILEHTADVGLRAFGETIPDLFSNAARGMIAIALEGEPETQTAKPKQCRKFTVRGEDREELLVHFLSEVLYALDTEGWQFSDFRIRRIAPRQMWVEAWGERKERSEHSRVAVKAVTYHQVSVTQTSDGWEAVVYFDI